MKKIEENYQRLNDESRLFDIHFWQSQGDRAIFEAATEMLNDYFLIRGKNADKIRLQRTVEHFSVLPESRKKFPITVKTRRRRARP